MLDVGAAGNDDMQTEALVFSSDSPTVCTSVVKTESDQSANSIDKGSVAVEAVREHEKESSAKNSETSRTSPAKQNAEVENYETKQRAS